MIGEIIEEYKLIASKLRRGREVRSYPKAWSGGNRGEIVLIPGINEKWTFLGPLGDYLNNKGWRVHYPVSNTRSSIEEIGMEIEEYTQRMNLKKIITIGHSKGGLVARWLLASKIKSKISQTFVIAAPNRGTLLAYLPLEGIGQLKPNTKIIYQLNQGKNRGVINIYPKWDNHILPNSSLLLAGAKNIRVDIGGHTRILDDPETWRLIEREIDSRMKYDIKQKHKNWD